MFLYSFICAPLTAFTRLSIFCTLQLSSVFYLSSELSWFRVSFLKGDLQFSKFLKNTICIGLCKLKCTEKRFIPFFPLHFLPEFVPHTEFKGRPEETKWNVLCHTTLRNYASISLQVPSILSILLGRMCPGEGKYRYVGQGWEGQQVSSARIYRPSFHENKPKTLVFT